MTAAMETTLDDFQDGRITVEQPRFGYRAGVDPVLLAASIPARSGQSILELGCGVGVASFCLGSRVEGLNLYGIERQPDYAEIARTNADRNGVTLNVFTGDLEAMPSELREMSFDHVLANPPYFQRDRSHSAEDQGREIAMGEDTPLEVWVKVASKRLAPKGYASFIHRAERLPELLAAASKYLGSVQVLPLVPRVGRDPRLILLRARKGGKAPFRLHDSIVVHSGEHHERDQADYTEILEACLKHGKALPFPS